MLFADSIILSKLEKRHVFFKLKIFFNGTTIAVSWFKSRKQRDKFDKFGKKSQIRQNLPVLEIFAEFSFLYLSEFAKNSQI